MRLISSNHLYIYISSTLLYSNKNITNYQKWDIKQEDICMIAICENFAELDI